MSNPYAVLGASQYRALTSAEIDAARAAARSMSPADGAAMLARINQARVNGLIHQANANARAGKNNWGTQYREYQGKQCTCHGH
jgi:hypothetical protein